MDIRQLGARRLGTDLPWISFGTVEREREGEGEGETRFGEVTLERWKKDLNLEGF